MCVCIWLYMYIHICIHTQSVWICPKLVATHILIVTIPPTRVDPFSIWEFKIVILGGIPVYLIFKHTHVVVACVDCCRFRTCLLLLLFLLHGLGFALLSQRCSLWGVQEPQPNAAPDGVLPGKTWGDLPRTWHNEEIILWNICGISMGYLWDVHGYLWDI